MVPNAPPHAPPIRVARNASATAGWPWRTSSEPLPDEEGKAPKERETISKAGAEQIIPKEKKRAISADQRADFEKAMKRYQEAKKGDGMSRSECSGVADAFKRVATAVAKYHICKRAPGHAYEALECFGGNGYVEASGMPRLYREAPLCSIWEGSGNVMALDVLRALSRTARELDELVGRFTL